MSRGAIIDPEGRLVSSKNPIRPNKDYSMYLTGLGVGRNSVQVDQILPVTISLCPDATQDCVLVTSTEISYMGNAPHFPGLDQVNFRLPRKSLTVIEPTKCVEYRVK